MQLFWLFKIRFPAIFLQCIRSESSPSLDQIDNAHLFPVADVSKNMIAIEFYFHKK